MITSLRVHKMVERSLVNGPGRRFVLWTQGCPFHCPGCFNRSAADPEGGRAVPLKEILALLEESDAEGITLSGGEPFMQAESLLPLMEECRRRGYNSMIYTGCLFEDLKAGIVPASRQLLARTDLLIDGPFISDIPPEGEWCGSGNQRVLALSRRGMDMKKRRKTRLVEREYILRPDGELLLTGI